MNLLAFIQEQLVTNNFASGAIIGGAALAAMNQLKMVPLKIFKFLKARLITRVTVHCENVDYQYFQELLNKEKFDKFSRNYRAVKVISKGTYGDDRGSKSTLAPDHGTFFAKVFGKWTVISCVKENSADGVTGSVRVKEYITLTYFGRNRLHAERIVEEIKELKDNSLKSGVAVYVPTSYEEWRKHSDIEKRSIQSVILQEDQTAKIIKDVENFRDSTERYRKFGVPYKRNYLFSGPAGTGKTSLVHAIASTLQMSVYSLTLSPGKDIAGLLSEVEDSSIVLLEDVDCLLKIQREDSDTAMPSLSNLLNALDGLVTKRGTIVIMTTNHPEKLDEALRRPGRMDVVIEFTNCNRQQLNQLFTKFYEDAPSELVEEFSGSLEEGKYSPAFIQEFCMKYATADEVVSAAKSLQIHN